MEEKTMSHYSHKLWRALALALILGLGLVALGTLRVPAAHAAPPPGPYFNGFEDAGDVVACPDSVSYVEPMVGVTQVASGTNGVTSASGGYHAEVPKTPVGCNIVTRLGGYSSTFPAGGYSVSIDIYLDTAKSIVGEDKRIAWTVASNGANGNHRRDFVFSIGTDELGGWVMSASNNAPGWPGDPSRSPYTINTTGWYTFKHIFRDDSGVLAVDMQVLDASGTVLKTWTLSNPADTIPSIVGGNRYGWFFTNQFDYLPVDNLIRTGFCPDVCYADVVNGSDASGDGSFGNPFKTIQKAVNTVNAGGMVYAFPGTYPEAVNVNKSVTISGDDPITTIVAPSSNNGFNIVADDVTLKSMTVQNGTHGVLLRQTLDNITFDNMRLVNNKNQGINMENNYGGNTGELITNVLVKDSHFEQNKAGIRISSTTQVDGIRIENSTFENTGIGFYEANDNKGGWVKHLTVSGSAFTNNAGTAALYAEEFSFVTIEDTTFSGNNYGALLWDNYSKASSVTTDIVVQGNTFTNNHKWAFQLTSTTSDTNESLLKLDGNTFSQDLSTNTGNVGQVVLVLNEANPNGSVEIVNNDFSFTDTLSGGLTGAWGIVTYGGYDAMLIENNTLDGNNRPLVNGIKLLTSAAKATANTVITKNTITGFVDGVTVTNGFPTGGTLDIVRNDVSDNSGYGIQSGSAPITNGTCNWWGAADGPGPVGPGSGSNVSTDVDYHGWLTSSNLNGVCSAPAPAPVGNGKIVFTAWNSGGKSDIFVMDNNSFNEVNLTNSAGNNDFDPVWSPDGTQIAFTSDRDGNNEIYVMNADGTGVVRLTNEPGNDAQPAWSPDGTKLLFISNRDDNNEVWVMNADGTGATQLTSTASPVTHKNPTWKPDGSRIAYTSNKDTVPSDGRLDEIYLANPDGTGEVRLTTTPNSVTNPYYSRKPDWSPDGSKILFFSRRTASNKDIIYTMLDNGTVEPAQTPVNLSGASPRANAHGRWAPDGSRIVFTSCRDDYGVSPNWNSCGDGGNHEIYVINADGSNQTRLTHNLLRLDDSPDWQAIPKVIPAATCTTDCYVAPNGSDANSGASAALPLKSIQLAIDTVQAGGTVHFAAGNYFENSYFGWVELTATKSIKLLGAGSGQSIIQLPVHKTNGLSIDGTGLNINIEGLTFTHRAPGTLASGFNIRIGETNAANAEVTFTDVESAYANGRNALLEDKGTYDSVTVTNSNFHHANAMGFSITGEAKDIIVTGSHFDDNGTSSSSIAFGFHLEVADGANHIRLSNSTFNNNNSNDPTRSLGISLAHVSDVVIDNIEASNNVTGLSIPEWLAASSNIEIKNSTMNGNIVGIYLDALAGYTIDNVSIHHNDLTGNTWYGVNVFNSSRLTNLAINRNDVSGNTLGGINANNLSSYTVNGTCNWWGDMSGPGPVGTGSGSNVSNKVDFGPWLRESNLNSYLVTNTDTTKVFCGIQQAIDDGDTDDGDTIMVSGGWAYPYSELVDVYKSVHLIGDGAATTTIEATTDVSSSNEKAVIQVRDGKSAEITGFTIAGPGPDTCGSILTGIFVREGATANIHDNTITAIRDNDGNSTCQNGFGIFVGRKLVSTTGTATITNNTLTGYQKGGIIVDNTGSNATLSNNIITGSGSNNHVAQNGVQISRGATATFTGNDISLHQFSGSTWIATGVLLYDAGNVTINNNNLIHDNGYGIYIRSTGARSSEADGPQPVPFDAEFDDLMNQGRSADAITAGTVAINNNRIYGNAVYGAFATGISGIDGRCNWWGSAGGPSGGDKVNTNIVYTPFRTTNNMDDSCALRLGDSGTAKWTLFLPVTR